MEKITSLTSADIVADNIQLLKQLFPTIVKEDKIDLNELKSLLGESVEEKDEYYRFTWAGKNQARLEANKPTTATLRPNKKDSKDWDTTNNIFIEGDNLEVLKLLQKSYANKIKMIYIDPPYNTGNDFIYKDDYSDNLGNYLKHTRQLDNLGNKTSTNTESSGRYHSNWLNMMYPRLRLARNLMTDDGVIFISIDDNEVHNLRKLCDEIFEEDNFEANVIPIVNPGGRDYKQVAITNEYLLVYSKSQKSELNEIEKKIEFKLKDSKGGFEFRELRNRNPKFHSGNRPNLFYAFYVNPVIKDENGYCTVSLNKNKDYNIEVHPYNSEGKESVWRWGKSKSQENIVNDSLDNSQVLAKQKSDGNWNIYEKNRKATSKAKSVWDESEMRTEDGTRMFRKLFDKNYFDHPKPVELVKKSIKIGSNKESYILDFFAGSGTTAHAVMQLNAEDGGNRKCISVQLPEPTDEKSEAYKAKYFTIAEITKERIRRAGDKIKQDCKDKEGIEKLDIGFKAFTLDSSNIRAWDGNPDNLAEQLDAFANNIKTDRTEEDILFEILLKYGLDLTVAIEEKTIAQQKVFSVGLGTLFICLSNTITPEVSEGIGTWKQELNPTRCRVIFKDTGFASDKDKVNSMQILKRFGVEDVNSI